MIPFDTLLRECEELVRQGRDDEAQRRLRRVEPARVPRPLRLEFANLCRRCGLVAHGLRLLTPVIRPPARGGTGAPATAAERCEYAMLLQRSGAVTEALAILEKIDPADDPRALLYQAFCHFNEWNYEAALPRLQSYLEHPMDDYARLIARVNLVACLLTLRRFPEAEAEIARAFRLAEESGAERLRGNLHELRAQLHMARLRHPEARADLNEAQRRLGGIQNEDLLFVRKWKAVIELRETGARAPLEKFRADAERAGDWESAREARLFLLTGRHAADDVLELVIGTPFPGYRARILEHLASLPELPARWRWGAAEGLALDLATGELTGPGAAGVRPPTAKCLHLIEALSQDLFRPQRLATLFGRLFPREHFDIFSSPQRVHQILARTRRWLAANRLPLDIVEEKGQFRLRKPERFALILPLAREPRENHQRLLQRLERDFREAPYFTGPEAAAVLGISQSRMKRVLAWGVSRNLLQRAGRGSGTTYSLRAA